MTSKAELEAEIIELKKILESSKSEFGASLNTPNDTEQSNLTGENMKAINDMLLSINKGDVDINELIKNVEDSLKEKPALVALLVFTIGFLMGRIR